MLALKGTIITTDVRLFLDDPARKPDDRQRSGDADHGRSETRTASVSTDIAWLSAHQWPGLRAIGKVVRSRETGAKTTSETAYYVPSEPEHAKRRVFGGF